jgi:hypothetical protein
MLEPMMAESDPVYENNFSPTPLFEPIIKEVLL